jgi:tRNA threonylcarbamoyladenosine modification (KEOPS) complex  Pcc1 subunit
MNCTAKLFVKGDPEKLFECLTPEETSFDRSSFTINKTKEGLEFDIKANDAVALRATLNSISQLLIVFEGASKKQAEN